MNLQKKLIRSLGIISMMIVLFFNYNIRIKQSSSINDLDLASLFSINVANASEVNDPFAELGLRMPRSCKYLVAVGHTWYTDENGVRYKIIKYEERDGVEDYCVGNSFICQNLLPCGAVI
ncbi:hypothetical protein [Hyunsoonleella ulvae]|uniref:hypothetical protein n=1 Tax=Hyunsoonleella ulvae TaxID=2799948 RepID=UPI00193947C0|nr:hypothetical protein [Hyunsoonleella ulvae]